MKKKYQKILGVSDFASPEELKKAFRKKANEFHPDKNPSKNAQQNFIEICEAYKALVENKFKKITPTSPDTSVINKKYNKGLSPEEFEERLKRAREYAKIKSFKEKNIRELSYHQIKNTSIKRLHKFACIISLVFITINSLDFLVLEPNQIKGQLVSLSLNGVYLEYTILDIEASKHYKKEHPHTPNYKQYIKFITKKNYKSWNFMKRGAEVTIYKSYLFDDLLGASSKGLSRESINKNAFRFHLLFWVYFVLLLSPILIAFTKGPNSFYIVTIYLCTYLSLVTVFIFLLNLLIHFYV